MNCIPSQFNLTLVIYSCISFGNYDQTHTIYPPLMYYSLIGFIKMTLNHIIIELKIINKVNKMRDGFFITFEGVECCGKTTLSKALKQHLDAIGMPCIRTKEPGGTSLGQELRKLFKYHNGDGGTIGNMSELYLMCTDRALHIENVIAPNLAQGKVVICDRFIDSTTAYQGWGNNMREDVEKMNSLLAAKWKPDLTFYPQIAYGTMIKRIRARNEHEPHRKNDRFESRSSEYFKKVITAFDYLSKLEPDRFVTLSAKYKIPRLTNIVIDQTISRLIQCGVLHMTNVDSGRVTTISSGRT